MVLKKYKYICQRQ